MDLDNNTPPKGVLDERYADLTIKESEDSIVLKLKIQPKAAKDEIVGLYGNALKVRITAPPVDGKANAHTIAFLAKFFGVKKKQVQIIAGEKSREKRVLIRTLTKEIVINRLRG